MSDDRPKKIFVFASEELCKECVDRAEAWLVEDNQRAFADNDIVACCAVAEYIANEKGFTLYKRNAKYPKQKVGES